MFWHFWPQVLVLAHWFAMVLIHASRHGTPMTARRFHMGGATLWILLAGGVLYAGGFFRDFF